MFRVDYPKGHYRNPTSDKEISEKFRSVASEVMTEKKIKEVTHVVYLLGMVRGMGFLTESLRFNKQKSREVDS